MIASMDSAIVDAQPSPSYSRSYTSSSPNKAKPPLFATAGPAAAPLSQEAWPDLPTSVSSCVCMHTHVHTFFVVIPVWGSSLARQRLKQQLAYILTQYFG